VGIKITAYRRASFEAVEHGCQLLTGDGSGGAGAVRHACLHGPGLGFGVPSSTAVGVLTGHARENRPDHGAGYGGVGAELPASHTGHDALLGDIGNCLGIPV